VFSQQLDAAIDAAVIHNIDALGRDGVAGLVERGATDDQAQAAAQRAVLLERLDPPTVERLVRLLLAAVDAAKVAMPYAYPRLAVVDHVGDAPAVPQVVNRVRVAVRLGAEPPAWTRARLPER
jgi:hypothetical protein